MWVFLATLILAGFLHLSAAVIQAKSHTAKPLSLSNVVPRQIRPLQDDGRIFVAADVTPQVLIGLFGQHMSIEAEKLIKPYLGKWMQVSGALGDVSAPKNFGVFVHFKQSSSSVFISMIFDKEWVDRLSILQKDSQMTVIGQISEIRSSTFELRHCELTSNIPAS
jgi:hypothetical protein